jgi:hypothetical protein
MLKLFAAQNAEKLFNVNDESRYAMGDLSIVQN